MRPVLSVDQVYKYFGGVRANENISMQVEQGSIVGLIGPNGSGKTTLFNSIVGTHPIDKGSIKFEDKEVSTLPVPVIAKLGLLRTFQQTRIYGKLNCIDNMRISAKPAKDNLFSVFSTIPTELSDKAENLLSFVGLYQKRKLRAGDLSFGQQKLLELAMALMNEPKMLLLDEPTAGVAPKVMDELFNHIIKVRDTGVAILMVEQNARQALTIADRGYVLVTGENKFSGSGKELLNDPEVRRSFLGG